MFNRNVWGIIKNEALLIICSIAKDQQVICVFKGIYYLLMGSVINHLASRGFGSSYQSSMILFLLTNNCFIHMEGLIILK